MAKVEERCCGCSVITGCLVLLLAALVGESVHLYSSLKVLLQSSEESSESTINTLPCLYYIIVSSLGITSFLLGIYGIYKNLPKYLNPSFYFFCYYAIYICVVVVLMNYAPTWYSQMFTVPRSAKRNDIFSTVYIYFVGIGLMFHFTQVVRHCRDFMMERNKNSVKPSDLVAVECPPVAKF